MNNQSVYITLILDWHYNQMQYFHDLMYIAFKTGGTIILTLISHTISIFIVKQEAMRNANNDTI